LGERDERRGGAGGADFGSAMGPPLATRGGLGWGGGRWRVVPPESPTRATGMGELACGIFFEGNTAMEAPTVTLLKKTKCSSLVASFHFAAGDYRLSYRIRGLTSPFYSSKCS
jgi:hypothetical protein